MSSAGESPPYRAWFEALPLKPGRCAAPEQLHTPLTTEAIRAGWYEGVDGLWGGSVWFAVRTADCVPLVVWDDAASVKAMVHAGRAGIGSGIVEAAVTAVLHGGGERETIRVSLGPHIRHCCYRFPRGSAAARVAVGHAPDGTHEEEGLLVVDLAREISARLERLGIESTPFIDRRCTCCHPTRLPSHRRQGNLRRRSLLSLSGPNRKEPAMNVDAELVSILACPETKEPVELAADALIARLNQLIQTGSVKNRGGEPVTETVDGGLIREDRRFLYPIREDIPIMLIEEAIELPPLGL